MPAYAVIWNRPFGFVWGVAVRADRAEVIDGAWQLFDGDRLVYQMPAHLVRRVEPCASERDAERLVRAAREQLPGGGPGAASMHVDEGGAAGPGRRPTSGVVERRRFAIEERILPRRDRDG